MTMTAPTPLDDALTRLQPLCALSPLRRSELAGLCVSEEILRGQNPFSVRGIQGQSVYLLAGELKLGFTDHSSSVQVGGCEAANWPLAKQLPALLDAKAITDIKLLRIDDDVLDIMMTWDQLSAAGEGPAKKAQRIGGTLQSGDVQLPGLARGVLSRLPAANIDALFHRFERIRVKAGELILREGESGDYYYLIESGRCAVTRRVGGVDMQLAELRAGEAFGEEALVADCARNATVCMESDGVLLRLAKPAFIELLREPLLTRVTRAEAERKVAAGAQWLDVRYPSEYQLERLPGAINVPLGEIRHAIGVLDRACEYVVYCQTGRRSSAAAFLLSQQGYRACCLENGLLAVS